MAKRLKIEGGVFKRGGQPEPDEAHTLTVDSCLERAAAALDEAARIPQTADKYIAVADRWIQVADRVKTGAKP